MFKEGAGAICAVLIDPNKLYRNALRTILEAEDVAVVDEFDTIDGLMSGASGIGKVHVFLIEAYSQLKNEGLIPRIREQCDGAKIVLIADRHYEADRMLEAMTAGADGILLSDLSPAAFLQSLRLVCLGEKVLPAQLTMQLMGRNQEGRLVANQVWGADLSEREIQILDLLATGASNKHIAIDLNIAEATVKVHVKAVLRKIKVANRTQAAVWAFGQVSRPVNPSPSMSVAAEGRYKHVAA